MDWLRIILVDIHPAMCAAWARAFAGLPNVEIVCGRFQDAPHSDLIATAGNSFGIMDGGLDGAMRDFFGWRIEQSVQRHIAEEYQGEMPVGSIVVVPTGHDLHHTLLYAPTMRVPMRIPSENVYLATAAILREARRWAPQHITLLIPALGMGTGGVPYDEGARLMALAYEYALHPPERMTWGMAVERHQRIKGE